MENYEIHEVESELEVSLCAVLESAAISRLVEEVRSADSEVSRAYNRTYNRHNR